MSNKWLIGIIIGLSLSIFIEIVRLFTVFRVDPLHFLGNLFIYTLIIVSIIEIWIRKDKRWILLVVGVIIVIGFLVLINQSDSINDSRKFIYVPTQIPTPVVMTQGALQTRTPQEKTTEESRKATDMATWKAPTIVSKVSNGCVRWSKVTIEDRGKKMCVYGMVLNAYDSTRMFYITFGLNDDDFRFVDYDFYYENIIGNCAKATGIVKTYLNMPYIELNGELYRCN